MLKAFSIFLILMQLQIVSYAQKEGAKSDSTVWGYSLQEIQEAGGAKAFFNSHKAEIMKHAAKLGEDEFFDFRDENEVVYRFSTLFNYAQMSINTAITEARIAITEARTAIIEAETQLLKDKMVGGVAILVDNELNEGEVLRLDIKSMYDYFKENNYKYLQINTLNKEQQKELFRKAGYNIKSEKNFEKAYESLERGKEILKLEYEWQVLDKEYKEKYQEKE